jgi:hypothetical protein
MGLIADCVVHGVGVSGQYLGLVSPLQCQSIANCAPPSIGNWRWSIYSKRWVDSPALDDLKALAGADIDAAAGAARLRYITDVPGQQVTYLRKAEQAAAFTAAGFVGGVPAYIQAEADATGQTPAQACQSILAVSDLWEKQVGPLIEFERRRAKLAAAAAQTADDLATVRTAALVALAAI